MLFLQNTKLWYHWKENLVTKVKLAKLGQPKPVEIGPVESLIKNFKKTKSYKITENPNNMSVFLVKKGSFI